MTDTFAIALIQHACSDALADNLAAVEKAVREAAARGAQVICLQELCLNRYFCSAEDASFFSLAEPADGPLVSRIQRLAAELSVVVVFPFFERRGAGVYHNSAAIIDADGELLGMYRKMHIPDDPLYYEKFYFTPGDSDGESSGYRVFETRFAKLGVLICWDQWYPEAARITSLLGAEIIFYPTAIGWHPAEKKEHGLNQWSAWQTIQRGHAIANGIYIAAANRIGYEPALGTDGIEFFGRSFVSDPFGQIVAEASGEKPEIVIVECSRRKMEGIRQNWPFFRDRRIDSYMPIARRWLAGDY